MPFGLLAGFGAALSWGTQDLISGVSSRTIGSLRVMVGIQLVCALILWIGGSISGAFLPLDLTDASGSVGLGLVGAVAYFAYFTGLQIGPISVVSGMVASYGGLTVVLAVLLRDESLTILQAFGVVLATIGVILIGVDFSAGVRSIRLAGRGVSFGVVAMLAFAFMAIAMDVALESAPLLEVLLISRLVVALVSIVSILMLRMVGWGGAGLSGDGPHVARSRVFLLVFAAGALSAAGLVSFATGLSEAQTWMVGLAASLGPAITILMAVVWLGERPKKIQWLGLATVALGVLAVGLP
jgi:drug/metabolite transporter (DMT)-like permease